MLPYRHTTRMTPYPHPFGKTELIVHPASLHTSSGGGWGLVHPHPDGSYDMVETVTVNIPKAMLDALLLIAGTLNVGCSPGWVEWRSFCIGSGDPLDHTGTIRQSTGVWLLDRGLLEENPDAWHTTYRLSARGKRVVELLTVPSS